MIYCLYMTGGELFSKILNAVAFFLDDGNFLKMKKAAFSKEQLPDNT